MKNIKQILFLTLTLVSILLLCSFDTSAREETTIGTLIDDEYTYTFPLMPERYEKLYGMPEDILSASTPELLEAFLHSQYMEECIDAPILSSNSHYTLKPPNDLSIHEGFVELSSRDDFLQTLDSYAECILTSSKHIEDRSITGFILLLSSEDVSFLMHASPYVSDGYSYLQTMYSTLEAAPSLSDAISTYTASNDSEEYYVTTGGKSILIFKFSWDHSTTDRNRYHKTYDEDGRTRLDVATTRYNCHSYAWYYTSTLNQYWMDDTPLGVEDSTCVLINRNVETIKASDIVIYFDKNDEILHSGVVDSVLNGTIMIRSKWGMAALYLHNLYDVPREYLNGYGGITVRFYRCHYYVNKYTGSNYHSGNYHYYECVDTCNLCGNSKNTTMTEVTCPGPPCPNLFSLTSTESDLTEKNVDIDTEVKKRSIEQYWMP